MLKLLCLVAVVGLSACWSGTPKLAPESAYARCVNACPSRICAPKSDDAKEWVCLPDPLKPEAGK